jgi:tRNA threonylcarbamoyladenosine biosynthesis protein TsaB
VEAKEHTSVLLPMVQELMNDAGAGLRDLDGIVLGNGPGSFIGMRIAASLAQGLAFGSGLNIVPVSSMAAVAAEVMVEHSATVVVVAQDARMSEAYLGVYRRDDDGLPVALADEALQSIGKIDGLAKFASPALIAAGQAWKKYPDLLDLNRAEISQLLDVPYPKARFLLDLGARGWRAGEAIEPEHLVPAYIRMKVAEKPAKA